MSKSDVRLSKSNDGFQTKIWGAPLWLFLHTTSLNYTPEKKCGYKMFFKSLKYILPCGACRINYANILKTKLPLNDNVFSCRESMAMWVFLLHNQVQKDIYDKTQSPSDKPKFKDTKADFFNAMQMYEQFRANCSSASYGCINPMKGSKKRAKINIVKYSKPRKVNAITNKSA
jgi:hypothetical protein